jgi:uncharacterized Zn finger protein
MRLVEQSASGPAIAEGLEYARLGQARSIDVQPGLVSAKVQGRMPGAYAVSIRLPVLSAAQWEQVLTAMTAQARFAAALLSGDLPPAIEEVFAPLGLRLMPQAPSDLAASCTCDAARGPRAADPGAASSVPSDGDASTDARPAAGGTGWCKHVCCVMTLLADRLANDPFTLFLLRGMAADDLLDQLRRKRAAAGTTAPGAAAAHADVPIYLPHLPGISDGPAAPLEASIHSFWALGPGLEELELPVGPPDVSHPLLRRLGPSPFDPTTARFPLVGLLATCYDLISAAAVRAEEGHDEPGPGVDQGR